MTRRDRVRVGGVAAALLVGALLVFLGWRATTGTTGTTVGDGPLDIGFGAGQSVTYPPEDHEGSWWASYGAALPCLAEESDPVRLRRVSAVTDAGPPPPRARFHVRTAVEEDRAGNASWSELVMGAYGQAPEFAERYAQPPMYEVGEFRDPAGLVIERACDDVSGPDGALRLPLQELVLSFEAEPGGSVVDRIEVEYEADGDTYRETLERRFVQCGPDVVREVANPTEADTPLCAG